LRTKLERLAEGWTAHIAEARAANTARSYATHIRSLTAYCRSKDIRAPTGVTPAVIAAWLRTKPADGGAPPARATRAARQAAVRMFFGWMHAEGAIAANPLSGVAPLARRSDAVDPARIPTPAQVERLMRAASGSDRQSVRLLAIMRLLYLTGARLNEVLALRTGDVGGGQVIVRRRGGSRSFAMDRPTAKALEAWLELRTDSERRGGWGRSPALFRNYTNGGPLTDRAVAGMVSDAARAAKLPTWVSSRSLRHARGLRAAEAGASEAEIRELLDLAHAARARQYIGAARPRR
jgi:site-specific recombinase XerD